MSDTTTVKSVRQTQVCYDFELDQEDFELLLQAQKQRLIPYEEWVGIAPVGSEALGRVGIPGVQSVDYDLRFGPVVTILIDIEFATEGTLNAFRALIDDRVSRAKRLLGEEDPIKDLRKSHVTYEIHLDNKHIQDLTDAEETTAMPYEELLRPNLVWVPLSSDNRGIPGIEDIEYDEVDGTVISCRVSVEHDTEQTRQAICRVIRERLALAAKYLAEPDPTMSPSGKPIWSNGAKN
jgi:hypothetical protein